MYTKHQHTTYLKTGKTWKVVSNENGKENRYTFTSVKYIRRKSTVKKEIMTESRIS